MVPLKNAGTFSCDLGAKEKKLNNTFLIILIHIIHTVANHFKHVNSNAMCTMQTLAMAFRLPVRSSSVLVGIQVVKLLHCRGQHHILSVSNTALVCHGLTPNTSKYYQFESKLSRKRCLYSNNMAKNHVAPTILFKRIYRTTASEHLWDDDSKLETSEKQRQR